MLTISKQQLSSARATVSAGGSKRSPVAWQQTILFQSDGEHVTLATGAMNGFVWATFDAAGPVFRVAVKAAELAVLCSAARSDEFRITHEGNKLVFDGDSGRLALACYETMPEASDGWPSLPKATSDVAFTIPAKDLAYAIKAAAPAMDESSERFALGNVQVIASLEGLKTYATNGKVAVRVKTPCEWLADDEFVMLIPSSGVGILSAMLRGVEPDANVSVSRSNNSIIFDAGSATAHITEENGRFPQIEKLINEHAAAEHSAVADMPVDDLRAALRECTIGFDPASGSANSVLLACNAAGCRLFSNSHCDNDMRVSIRCDESRGEGGCILVDQAFVGKMAASAGTPSVRVTLGPADRGLSQVLMILGGDTFAAVAMGCSIEDGDAVRAREALAG